MAVSSSAMLADHPRRSWHSRCFNILSKYDLLLLYTTFKLSSKRIDSGTGFKLNQSIIYEENTVKYS